MAKKITQEQVAKMIELYSELKTYSAVGKALGISPSTVSKYLKEEAAPPKAISFDGPAPSDPCNLFSFGILTAAEQASLEEWYAEYGVL